MVAGTFSGRAVASHSSGSESEKPSCEGGKVKDNEEIVCCNEMSGKLPLVFRERSMAMEAKGLSCCDET